MRLDGPARRLKIYVGESDQWRGRPLYLALLEALKKEGLAGATVVRGVAGFGAHSRIHTAALEALSGDLPLVVEVIDTREKIEHALAIVGPMVNEGLITLDDTHVITYTHRYLNPLPGDRLVREVMSRDVSASTRRHPWRSWSACWWTASSRRCRSSTASVGSWASSVTATSCTVVMAPSASV